MFFIDIRMDYFIILSKISLKSKIPAVIYAILLLDKSRVKII